MKRLEKELEKHLRFINPQEKNSNRTLIELLKSEYRRRLVHYENVDRGFREKYGMSFEEFERRNIVKERGFSWEVEADAMDWEQAIDGIKTMKGRLQELDVLEPQA